ncbi:phytanoyl-CoA dioxygenase family protein [Aquibaculum arenosum]|uniref:Phytanoyl-CoA dioxygenase family protein n=1 Tax=Aquibaculum arenosum TaxID=3032591 RepID=A0ABT5YP34_9PROT|nr:phytanoyl-CoA dioxygenase family protein [Fodinicurvata sp. CAU 1616]MDF2096724.1 phytanoyl-CoA dioxygenase family protein [Fodinicurvata sp. CAU 1616]
MTSILTPEQKRSFEEDGLVFVRGLFDAQETGLLRRAMEEDPAIRAHMIDRADADGAATRISLWNRAGNSVYGLAARCARMVDTAEDLLGEEVYHFQSKLTAKEPRVGGAWEWHQDYGYWYYNGCLRPNMLSCMIALDRTDRTNGCLQIVKGSHHLGRIDHVPVSSKQNAADPERMEHILEKHEVVYCELDPGDAVIFHCNALHRSDQNRSDKRRWTLLICYNAASNDAYVREDDRSYVPLDRVPDSAIKDAGLAFAGDGLEHFASKPYVPDVARSAAAVASGEM